MAWTPTSGAPIQLQKSDGTLASDYYIKFYQSGTTTAFSMATDSTGGTTLAKAKINSSGYPVNGSDAVFIPHVNQAYKIVLYKNATDADNDTTGNADWVVDAVEQVQSGTGTIDAANVTYTSSGTGAVATNVQAKLREFCVSLGEFGAAGDGVTDDTTAIQTALDSGNRVVCGEAGKTYYITGPLSIPANTKFRGNGATITCIQTGFPRGSLPGLAGMIHNENASITNGSVKDDGIEISDWVMTSGSDLPLSTIYLANTDNARVFNNTISSNDTSGYVLSHIDIHHSNDNCVVEKNNLENTNSTLQFGACMDVRNSNSLTPSNNITVRDNYMYKNSPNGTDEIMWVNGGDGVVNNVLVENNTYESGPSDNTSSQLTIYPFTNGGAITTSDIKYIKIKSNHFVAPSNVDNALLLGIVTDTVKEVRHIIVTGNTFDLDSNTAVSMQSPVNHCVISNNSINSTGSGNASGVIAVNAVVDNCYAKVINNTLEGMYGTCFLGNYVEGNDADECEVFAQNVRSCINNTIDECKHNLVNDTKYGGEISGNTVNFFNKVTLSPDVPYVFYLAADKAYDVHNNNVTFSGDGFKMVYSSAAGSAGKIAFDYNKFTKDGATDSPRMDLGTTPKELKTSAGNDFYGVNTSHAADPGTGVFIDYGVPGYIPAQGHVTFFNDVAIGTAQDVAQIRISGNTYKLRADVVAS